MPSQLTAKNVFLLYGIIIVTGIAGSLVFLYGSSISDAGSVLHGIANATLTQGLSQLHTPPSQSYFIFVMIVTMLSGVMMNTVLLWLCRQLLGNVSDKTLSLKNAFNTTLTITAICLVLLMAFFVYSVPAQYIIGSRKWLACLTLAVGSFHLAGMPFYSSFFESGYIESNFVLQLGITGGVTLGNLGIFVIHELFSPIQLRQRLADPSIDWSLITKVSVFAGAIGVGLSSAGYYFMEREQLLAGKNIMEVAIASVYEITSARGFGLSMFEAANSSSEILKNFSALFLAGPFGLGGGLTLLVFSPIFLLRTKRQSSVAPLLINKNLLIITFISILIGLLGVLVASTSAREIIPAYTGYNIIIMNEPTWGATILTSFLMIAGRVSLIAAAFSVLNNVKHTGKKI